MVSQMISCLSKSSSLFCISRSQSPIPPKTCNRSGLYRFSPGLASRRLYTVNRRRWRSMCIFNSGKETGGEGKLQGGGSEWPILERWEVPWEWQTVSLTSLACGLSFVLTGLTEMIALPYLGIDVQKLSLDDKAEILFLDQGLTTAVVLAVIFTVARTFDPLPEDILRYDLKQPFNLRKGWLVWSGIGLVGAVGAIALTGVALSLFRTEAPEREVDSLMKLLPLIGSSNISTLSLVGITGVLAPLLEETVFRGFFMVSLTKWVPTPIAIIISSAAFALAHLTPGEFPQLFILGSVLGLSYAQTRNLITPMVIHGFWNSGVILLLTFLQIQGYDIKELLMQGN
ncbi:CAAX amino terminal protease family protein [Hirschfeldia incana]|nr:CAAX amino terminal protease family protein [Hirschfeldia incana]